VTQTTRCLIGVAFVGLTLTGCTSTGASTSMTGVSSGSSSEAGTGTSGTPDEAEATPSPPITQVLPAMVPQIADFPADVRSLRNGDAALDRGYVTNAKASTRTPDPTDTGADLARLGRTGGYRYTVAPYSFVTTFALAEPSVDAFRSDQEAQRFLNSQFSDLRAQDGKADPDFRGTIEGFGPIFVPPALGPAQGVRYTVDLATVGPIHIVVEGFRVGRVVGWSKIARLDKVDPRPLADELAQTLRRRMERVSA
jgi:hypothetical protein